MSVNQISSQGVWLTCPLNKVLPPVTGNVGDVNILSLNGDFTFIPRNNFFGRIFTGTLTQNRTYAYPDQSGTIALVGGSGVGTVTNVSVNPLSPLFNATVANPTTTPVISFSAISQAQNLFYASPNGVSGNPVFRAIVATDIVPINAAGFLNNDGLGNLSWQTIGGTISGLTTGFIPVATSPTSIGNSIMSQSGSIVSLPGGLRMTDQSPPSPPASGSLIMESFNQQGFSVPHIYDTQGNAIEMLRDNLTIVRNVTGSGMTKGQVVYVSGTTGTVPQVSLAKANSTSTLGTVMVLYENISNNGYGRAVYLGNIENFDLSSFSNGDILYVSSTTAGALTNVAPTNPNFAQQVGTVLNNGVGNGVLFCYTRGITYGGTVTSFSAGSLSPLFTTSVATATITPALSFSLTNAGANTYFGNATGSSAAPSYTAAGSLTRTNDTNVTLTLGGSPTVSLLAATSLTLGWTGQLSPSRGGTGLDTSGSTGVAQVAAGTWSVSTALDNGTTTTTQAALDGSTKVATTLYADRVAGDMSVQLMQALGSTIKAQPIGVVPSELTANLNISSGNLIITAVYLPYAQTITGVKWWQSTKGSYTGTHGYVGLYTYSGGNLTQVAISNDTPNILQTASSSSMGSLNFSGTYPAAAGVYYIALLYTVSASSTTPAIGGGTAAILNAHLVDLTNGAMLVGVWTGQTSLPSGPTAINSWTVSSNNYYLALY